MTLLSSDNVDVTRDPRGTDLRSPSSELRARCTCYSAAPAVDCYWLLLLLLLLPPVVRYCPGGCPLSED